MNLLKNVSDFPYFSKHLLANCREALNFLHNYLGLYDYFDFKKGQPYMIIPYCTVIQDPRVSVRLVCLNSTNPCF